MKLHLAIAAVLDAEAVLCRQLKAVGDRHQADHDVFHMTRLLSQIATANRAALAPHSIRYATDELSTPGQVDPEARESTYGASSDEEDLRLLADLRQRHLLYATASIDWVILAQGAQAAQDTELLKAVSSAHTQTLRGLSWSVTRIKTAAPQILMS